MSKNFPIHQLAGVGWGGGGWFLWYSHGFYSSGMPILSSDVKVYIFLVPIVARHLLTLRVIKFLFLLTSLA